MKIRYIGGPGFIIGNILLGLLLIVGVWRMKQEFDVRLFHVEQSLTSFRLSLNALGDRIFRLETRVEAVFKWLEKVEVSSGKASWYGVPFHGRMTANGEQYNMFALTAASQKLPAGTRALVLNRRTRLSCVVRINDVGPFVSGRIMDLSYRAAQVLGMVRSGVDPVLVCSFGM
jgi:hypothetical protein